MNVTTTRFLGFAGLSAFTSLALHAGSVTGRVQDQRGQLTLQGARVAVVGTPWVAYTDAAGTYSLPELPSGPATLEFSYVGLPTQTVLIDVPVTGEVVRNFSFGEDVVVLEKLVITDALVGSARAINQQRAATTLSNFIASDAIGRFPDQNAAESLQRVPGIALYRDQGEGRFVVVRGLKPDLNSVQINGVSMASPELGSRTVALDVIPSDALGSIEVTKVPTPDKPADGIGGIVNMKMKSPFDSSERRVSASGQWQYNHLSEEFSPKFNATYSDFLADGKLGFILSPTWQKRTFGSNNFEEDGGWETRTVNGTTADFLTGLAFRQYEIERTRYGINAGLEFKPSPATHLYVRGTFSHFADAENRYITFLPFVEASSVSTLDAVSASVTGLRRERHDVRIREKIQEISSLVFGGDHRAGAWRLHGEVAYSEGEEERPDELTARFRKSTRGTNWTYSFAEGTYSPKIAQTLGSDLTALSNASQFNQVSRLQAVNEAGRETELNTAFDARRDFTLGANLPAYVKSGVRYRAKTKRADSNAIEYAGAVTSNNLTYAQVAELQPNYPFFGGTRANAGLVQQAFNSIRASASGEFLIPDSYGDDWETDEDVFGAYAMGSVTLNAWQLLGGIRWENTQFSHRGFQVTDETTVTPVSQKRDYNNVLPGIYVRYQLTPDTLVRASVSTALSRPAFEESAIRRSINSEATPLQITEGNPNLKPLTATSFDLSVEHYLPSLGLVSAGVFHKELKDFTYMTEVTTADAVIETFANGNKGSITGLELAWQQQLRFLPEPFDGFGVLANYTLSSSSADYTRSLGAPVEKLEFIGQSRHIGNFGLSYEKGPLFLRAAVNFRSARLREDEPVGESAYHDRYVDDFAQLDLTGAYKLGRQWELFTEVLNVTNEPFRVYFGKDGTRLAQFEEYGWSANFGLRWNL